MFHCVNINYKICTLIFAQVFFYGYFLPVIDSRRAVISFWQKYGHLVLVRRCKPAKE